MHLIRCDALDPMRSDVSGGLAHAQVVLSDPVPIDTNLAAVILADGSLAGMARTWSGPFTAPPPSAN
jgi:hypothetical protein